MIVFFNQLKYLRINICVGLSSSSSAAAFSLFTVTKTNLMLFLIEVFHVDKSVGSV